MSLSSRSVKRQWSGTSGSPATYSRPPPSDRSRASTRASSTWGASSSSSRPSSSSWTAPGMASVSGVPGAPMDRSAMFGTGLDPSGVDGSAAAPAEHLGAGRCRWRGRGGRVRHRGGRARRCRLGRRRRGGGRRARGTGARRLAHNGLGRPLHLHAAGSAGVITGGHLGRGRYGRLSGRFRSSEGLLALRAGQAGAGAGSGRSLGAAGGAADGPLVGHGADNAPRTPRITRCVLR